MTYNKILNLVLISLFITASLFSSDDPCIQALGVNSPGQAAALSAKREGQSKPESFKSADKAQEGDSGKKDNDAQWKREWTADAAQVAGDWNTQAAPAFLAGAAEAGAKMDFKNQATLTLCYQKRMAQGQADQKVAEENRKNAAQARAADKETLGYDPRAIQVEIRNK